MSELMKSAAIITAPWLGWKILRELYVPKAFQWYAVSISNMAIRVVEFSNGGYKVRKFFA